MKMKIRNSVFCLKQGMNGKLTTFAHNMIPCFGSHFGRGLQQCYHKTDLQQAGLHIMPVYFEFRKKSINFMWFVKLSIILSILLNLDFQFVLLWNLGMGKI